MIIEDILNNRIVPFEYSDSKISSLFSFYLHRAPGIDSKHSMNICEDVLLNKWSTFKEECALEICEFISSNCVFSDYLAKNRLTSTHNVNRKSKKILCKLKDKSEMECVCVLRHIRNSIAHGNVYLLHGGNRKYIIFDDFNKSGNQSARILLSQTDLQLLKKIIIK